MPRFLSLSLILFAAFLPCAHAQTGASAIPPNTPRLAGGYKPVQISPEVTKAAQVAVLTQSKKQSAPLKLIVITQAESQVVAGMNYRLVLKVLQAGKFRSAQVVVYRNLQNHYQLTSWRWL